MRADKSNGTKLSAIPAWLVAGVDLSLVNLALYGAFIIVARTGPGLPGAYFTLLMPIVSLAALFLFSALGLYSRQRGGFMPVLRALITSVAGLTVVSLVTAFWVWGFIWQGSYFVIAPFLMLLFLIAWRILYWRLELWIHGRKKLLVIGEETAAQLALEKLMNLPQGYFEVVKMLEPEEFGRLEEWLPEVDAVMVAGTLSLEQKNEVIRRSFDCGCEVFVIPDLYEIMLTRAVMTQVHDTPLIECHDMQLDFFQQFVKRAFDLTVALLLALPALPIAICCGLAVKATSPGPVIFRQERVGLKGRTFTLYKLRTMVQDAEEELGPVFASEEDDRVTAVGRFLRSARLDELPQLINVLKGDLSIVGPRPERPYFVARFSSEMPEYDLRHLVKPGITGMAQVAGLYATNTRDKLRYDLYYVADYSLLNDIRILLLTIPTIFSREAARGVKREEIAAGEKLDSGCGPAPKTIEPQERQP